MVAQRSPSLTASYWNPILNYISVRSGHRLRLRSERTAAATSAAILKGEYDFAYTNHIFKPAHLLQGYRVILRPAGDPIRGQIVTLEGSSIHSLADLAGQPMGFPGRAAPLAYAVTMDFLLRRGLIVHPVFGGNQEGIMAQMKAGRVSAIGVNSQVMHDFAQREKLAYRVLWESEPYLNLPISVHPRVPGDAVEAVTRAFIEMATDPAGAIILTSATAALKLNPPFGFIAASTAEYQNQIDFYRTTVVRDYE